MRKEFQEMIDHFSCGDIDDVVGLFEFSDWIDHDLKSTDEAQLIDLTLEFVSCALKAGFKAGCSPYYQTGFKIWDDQTEQHVFERIKAEWATSGRPNLPTNIWFGLPGYNYT